MIELIVACFVTAAVSIGAAFLFMRKYSRELEATMKPQLAAVETALRDAEALMAQAAPQIKRSQSIIAQHGVQPRQIKTAEKYLAEDIIEQYPEAKMLLGTISPRTAEYFTENPDILLQMAERWGPKLKLLIGEGALTREGDGALDASRGIDWVHRS